MIKRLVEWLADRCERQGKILYIGGKEDTYLIRYYLFKSKYLSIFIHRFLRSDRDDLHDHPWNFVTYLVDGAYTEHRWNPKTQKVDVIRRENFLEYSHDGITESWSVPRKRNTLVFRRAEDQHKVLVDRPLHPMDYRFAVLTVCITGRSRREWGFVREDQPLYYLESQPDYQGRQKVWWDEKSKRYLPRTTVRGRRWYPWREYLGLPPDEPGRG